MALKTAFIMTTLLLGATAQAGQSLLEFKLADQSVVKERFYEKKSGSLHVYSLDRRFSREDGFAWVETLELLLQEAYEHYKQAVDTGYLPFCEKPPAKRPPTHLIFYNFKLESDHEGRAGYFHPENPGVLVQDRFWDSDTVQSVSLHEAVHAWCRHSAYDSKIERWLEEGAADWVMYKTLGKAPQLSISKYFENPCAPTLYGSSFLWWMALTESDGTLTALATTLAKAHLGLRLDVVHGELARTKCTSSKEALPGGFISAEKLSNTSELVQIPFWQRPHRRPELVKPASSDQRPSGYFVWTGPSLQPETKKESP